MDFEDDTSYTGPPVGDEAIRRAAERLRVSAIRSRARELAVSSPLEVRNEEDAWAAALDARFGVGLELSEW